MGKLRYRALAPVAVCLIITFAIAGASRASAAEFDFGVRAGLSVEEPDPFVGLELLTPIGGHGWFFNPNVEFVFADPDDRVSVNFDVHYDFGASARYYLWAGGGPAILLSDSDAGDDTDAGLNLLGGIGWKQPQMTPYAQLKIVIADDSEVLAGVGVRF
jgi:hypothetical protein